MNPILVNLLPVLFVVLQTDAAANGGIASLAQIIGGLKHHRAIVVTDRETPRVDEWRKRGVEVHVFPRAVRNGFFRNPLHGVRSYWSYLLRLRRLILRSGVKVIHANSPLALQLSIGAAKLTGAKLILNLRGTFDPERPPSRTRFRFLFGAADHLLFLSHDQARRWNERVPNALPPYSITYSAVDLESFKPSPMPSHERIVLVSGLIRPLKGQLEFIRNVVPTLAENGIKVWFAGDFDERLDSYRIDCTDAAKPFGDAVSFLGYRTDIPKLMAQASVIAVPSRHEGLVRAMIEAMSCARPVVSFDVCSARELLEEHSGGAGTVVTGGDHAGMAQALLAYCRDRERASKAGEKGVATASRLFDPESVVSRYEHVYELLGSTTSAAGKLANVAAP